MSKRNEDRPTTVLPADRELQAMIGNRLRARYDEILAEPVPDRFLALLDELDRRAADGTASGDGGTGREDHP
jgi:hypothetical protein